MDNNKRYRTVLAHESCPTCNALLRKSRNEFEASGLEFGGVEYKGTTKDGIYHHGGWRVEQVSK